MADDDTILHVWRDNDGNQDTDTWDDTALIKAYDKAVNLAKEEVAKRMDENDPESEVEQNIKTFKRSGETCETPKWTVGAPCRAIYAEDGKLYEATVIEIDEFADSCTVKFLGYGNTADVNLSSLLESEGLESQIAQRNAAAADQYNDDNSGMEYQRKQSTVKNAKRSSNSAKRMDCESESTKCFKNAFMSGFSFNSSSNTMPPAPPLPPQLIAKLPENDADALSSMLMSWYISGFHTGYYHGLKQAQGNQEELKNC